MKIGIHSINPNRVLPLVRSAAAAGLRWPLVKMVNDASPLVEVKAIERSTVTLCRYINPNGNWEGCQGVGSWTDAERKQFARDSIDLVFHNANAAQLAAVDYFAVQNEPDPKGAYDALGAALIELVAEADRRGIKLALPALPQGCPEWDDMQRLASTGLFGLMKASGHILDLHEGNFRDQAIDFGYADLIPGAPAVAGAGSTNFRHRYLYSILEQRGEVVPLVISEFYGGGRYGDPPAEQMRRFAWYAERASQATPSTYMLAFCPFTIDPNAGWINADYTPTFESAEMRAYHTAHNNDNGGKTMPILGVDVSENQPPGLPWAAWAANGLRFAIVRTSIGYRADTAYPAHIARAKAAGVPTARYHTLWHEDPDGTLYSAAGQANTFVSLIPTDAPGPAVLDVEATGIDEPFLRQFCDRYDALTTRPLVIYTSKTAWERLIGHAQGRYTKYGLWVADYNAGTPTSTPLAPAPRIPDTWATRAWAIWQFAGDNGKLPPYNGAIDLSEFNGTEAQFTAMFGAAGPITPPPALDTKALAAYLSVANTALTAAQAMLK